MISIDSVLNKVRREDIADEWEKKRMALVKLACIYSISLA